MLNVELVDNEEKVFCFTSNLELICKPLLSSRVILCFFRIMKDLNR
jgi:hypothetical protein